jgi:hypothetical protein
MFFQLNLISMKKIMILITGVILLTLTVLNFSQVHLLNRPENTLASILTLAKADGESGTNCFYQVKVVHPVYYYDECHYETAEYWSCWGGNEECFSGQVTYIRCCPSCMLITDGYLNLQYCSY